LLICTSKAGGTKVSFGEVHAPTDEKHLLLMILHFALLVAKYINIQVAVGLTEENDLIKKGRQWIDSFKHHLKDILVTAPSGEDVS